MVNAVGSRHKPIRFMIDPVTTDPKGEALHKNVGQYAGSHHKKKMLRLYQPTAIDEMKA
jgi:hypothetical protein